MSQPEMFATPDGSLAARGHSQLVDGCLHRSFPSEGEYPKTLLHGADGLDPEVEGRRNGERTRTVNAAAGPVDLVGNP